VPIDLNKLEKKVKMILHNNTSKDLPSNITQDLVKATYRPIVTTKAF